MLVRRGAAGVYVGVGLARQGGRLGADLASRDPACARCGVELGLRPVRPMNPFENWSSQRRSTGPVSRAASVVTKTTCALSRSAAGLVRSAAATSAIAVGHSSGQCV